MILNKPTIRLNVDSCSSENCNCCDVNYSSSSYDSFQECSSSSSSSLETSTTCSCNESNDDLNFEKKSSVQEINFKIRENNELDWINHFTDRRGKIVYLELLNLSPNYNEIKNNTKYNEEPQKKRSNYLNKITNWAGGVVLNKDEPVNKFDDIFYKKENQKLDETILRLFNLTKSFNFSLKQNEKLKNKNETEKNLFNDENNYIDESGCFTVLCLKTSSEKNSDDFLKYAYSRPPGKSIDTNILDHNRMLKLKGIHITLASILQNLFKENLEKIKIGIPRVTLLRIKELTELYFNYKLENDLLFTIAMPINILTETQFNNLTESIFKLIKFQWPDLRTAILNLENQLEVHKLFHIISFMISHQLMNSQSKDNLCYKNRIKEFANDFFLCEQLTLNVELLQYIQQIMIDFEFLSWSDHFKKKNNEESLLNRFSCINSAFFYKGKLICSNIYDPKNSSHSDLKNYLKMTGLISLTKISQIKFVKWFQVYTKINLTEQINQDKINNDQFYCLIIAVQNVLYATTWKYNESHDKKFNTIKVVPKRLINEGLHFIVRLIRKTTLIEEIDYELRLQSYWHSIPISLDDFKEKKGHILQKSFEIWNSLQLNYNQDIDFNQNSNKFKNWRKALIDANIHRNFYLKNDVVWLNDKKKNRKNSKIYNLLSSNNSTFFSIYNSFKSNSSNSSNNSKPKSVLFSQSDFSVEDLQCELNSLSKSLRSIRTLMIDYLVCYLIQDNLNSVYQAPILSQTLVKRLGNSFIKKFKKKCGIIENQLNFLYPNVKEIGSSFESRLPQINLNSNKKTILSSNNKTISKNSSNLINKKKEENFESFKTIKFWLQTIKLDENKIVFLCFLENKVLQSSIDEFLHNITRSKYR